jgi:SPOR domain
MIKLFSIIVLLIISCNTFANDTLKQSSSNIIVRDRGNVNLAVERHKVINERSIFINGFRIQISFTNNKEEAMGIKGQFYKQFSSFRCYTTYEQPYHKIRVGDYQNLNETKEDLRLLLKSFPGAFVVPDKVRRKKISAE